MTRSTLQNQSSAYRLHSGNQEFKTAHILLVEDDFDLNQQLSDLLQHQGYQVTSIDCGEKALQILGQKPFDLVLLDVNLPRVDGFSILNHIRESSSLPVIMLTAYGAEEHRIMGLKYGADDYISKPCNITEVNLRIEAVLRRTCRQSEQHTVNTLESNELILKRQSHQVSVIGGDATQEVSLTPIQFNLLWTLVENQGKVQSKPYLYQAVLEREFCQYDRSLDMHMSRIRKRLIAEGMSQDRIKTVHGKGYLFK